ncbi:MAG: phosphomannomutase/phosphoglucomutase [Candidatus Krumholzibacteria bacterium]|nr:phosphomannomutase/phosphoglucomutase [Candidatus Krumholzibacteria bacterium]
MPSHIFREYDIRGVVETDLTQDRVRRLGLAFATAFRRDSIDEVVVGRDVRPSSDAFFDAIADGLTKGGVSVIDIGVVPTPVFYFAARTWRRTGGVMITASHNPSEFNGFKVLRGEGTIYGDDILELRDLAEGPLAEPGGGRVTHRDARAEYVDYLAGNIKLARPVSFAADGGNGTAGIVARDLFSRLGAKPLELFMEPDGTFPNHHPDPTVVKNLAALKAAVLANKLELGVAFDGDSDRIGVIDDRGEILWGDRLLALFARDVLVAHPGSTVIFEVKCSESLIEDIAGHGGKPLMWKTGHSLIKKKMRETGALLAGEMSGHIFFADRYFGYDDALYAACRLLEIVSRSAATLSTLLEDLPRREATPEIRLDCADERKFDVVREVRDHFRKNHEVIDIDGARVKFDGGWGLIRASNTQPVLVLRFEAVTKERLVAIKNEIAGVLARYIDVSKLTGA